MKSEASDAPNDDLDQTERLSGRSNEKVKIDLANKRISPNELKKKLNRKSEPKEAKKDSEDEYEGKFIEFEARQEISMIGLWLYENGYFTKYPRIAFNWAIY